MIIGAVAVFNDASTIGRALDSLRPHVDRIIVVDGARASYPLQPGDAFTSTDGTSEIVAGSGAAFIQPTRRPWETEVEQRNQYLVGEPGDWYLVLDADEYLVGKLPSRAALEDVNLPDSYLVPIIEDANPTNIPPWRARLFRHVGWTTYRFAHFAIYRDGELMRPVHCLETLAVHHDPDRCDERNERRLAEKNRTISHERAFLRNGRPPQTIRRGDTMKVIKYEYHGGGAWVPGLPARDLAADDAELYSDLLSAHMALPTPLYTLVTETSSEGAQEPEKAIEEPGDTPGNTGTVDAADETVSEADGNSGKGRTNRKRSA